VRNTLPFAPNISSKVLNQPLAAENYLGAEDLILFRKAYGMGLQTVFFICTGLAAGGFILSFALIGQVDLDKDTPTKPAKLVSGEVVSGGTLEKPAT